MNQQRAAAGRFSPEKREAVYEAIFKRRDVRQFEPAEVPDAVVHRLLLAAHHGPSVGFMQPWNFIVIRSQELRAAVKTIFEEENRKAAERFEGERRATYDRLKLEGILESSFNLVVTCDPTRAGPHVLGRNSIPATDLYSTCCAVENLWLAARAEGLGVGWVSIIDNDRLKELLKIPAHVIPVAYLCVGAPKLFHEEPELQTKGWRNRLPLEELTFGETWGAAWEEERSK